MAISIVATVGGASSNSFAELSDWTSYMEGRLNSDAFDDADEDTQNRALAEATRELSAQAWKGKRTDEDQALAWPRQWVADPDHPWGDYYDQDVIPARIQRATYELAFEFLKAGTTDIAAMPDDLLVKQSTVDVLTTVYVEPHQRPAGLRRYPSVWREIGPLLTNSGIGKRTVRS